MKTGKISKVLAIFIGGLLSIALLVAGYTTLQGVSSRAEDYMPRDVTVTDLSSNSAKINWTTGTKTQAVVEYGISPTELNSIAPETASKTDHSLDLTLLASNTSYYFQISIGGKKYDNSGVPWTFNTKGSDGSTGVPQNLPTPISTVVIPNNGSSVNAVSNCNETDCEAIKAKFGSGCSTQDYIKCLKKITPTP